MMGFHDARLTRIVSLSLNDTKISDQWLAYIGKRCELYEKYDKGGGTARALVYESGAPLFAALEIAGTQISDAGVGDLVRIPYLSYLDISDTRITDTGVQQLVRSCGLGALGLRGTRITDRSVVELAKSRTLYMLDLRDTSVTNVGISKLKIALPNCTILK